MASDRITPLMRRMFLPALGWLAIPSLLQAAGPSPNARGEFRERVDLIEFNHYYDDLGRHQFDQVIFYEWSPDFRRFHVIAWSLVEGDLRRVPAKLPGSGEYAVKWYDRDARVQREVHAKLYRETWTQSDPERINKQFIEEKDRLSLAKLTARR
jgi:hypothetical protein